MFLRALAELGALELVLFGAEAAAEQTCPLPDARVVRLDPPRGVPMSRLARALGDLCSPQPRLIRHCDLERARSTPRGFYIVTADETVTDLTFIEVSLPPVVLHDLQAEGLTAGEVARELEAAVAAEPHEGAIVLIRARGRLSAGDPHELPFAATREALDAQGALCVKLSRSGLSGPVPRRGPSKGLQAKHEIEARVIAERCADFHPDPALDDAVRERVAAAFEADAGTETGQRVLEAVAVEPADGEAGRAFADRIRARAGTALPGLEEER
jgi:hypothetical protein